LRKRIEEAAISFLNFQKSGVLLLMRQWLDKTVKVLDTAWLVWTGAVILLGFLMLIARALYLAWK
jgi:hypothetical protein